MNNLTEHLTKHLTKREHANLIMQWAMMAMEDKGKAEEAISPKLLGKTRQ